MRRAVILLALTLATPAKVLCPARLAIASFGEV